MKKSCLLFLLASGISSLNAQSAVKMNPAETFAARKGTILEKRFDEVGKVGMLNIQVEYISDLSNNDKMRCIRFDIQAGDNTSGPSALLDSNEANEIISFLNSINANVMNHSPVDPNTEISYTTTYNIQVGCFWQKNNGWVLFMRIDSQNPATETGFSQSDLGLLLKTLTTAKTEIQKS